MGAHKNDVNECVWLMAGVVVLCIVLIGIGRIRSGNPARAAASRLTLQMCEDLAAASTAAKHALLTEDDQQCRLAAGQARAALAAVEERRQALEALLGKGTGEEEERTFRPFSQAVATLTQTEAAVLELVVQNASGRMLARVLDSKDKAFAAYEGALATVQAVSPGPRPVVIGKNLRLVEHPSPYALRD